MHPYTVVTHCSGAFCGAEKPSYSSQSFTSPRLFPPWLLLLLLLSRFHVACYCCCCCCSIHISFLFVIQNGLHRQAAIVCLNIVHNHIVYSIYTCHFPLKATIFRHCMCWCLTCHFVSWLLSVVGYGQVVGTTILSLTLCLYRTITSIIFFSKSLFWFQDVWFFMFYANIIRLGHDRLFFFFVLRIKQTDTFC